MTRYYGHPIKREGQPTTYTAKAHHAKNKDGAVGIIRLPPRHDISNHAPDFAWGPIMIGQKASIAQVPGAAQLALAILCHALNNDGRALALHQRFKMRVMGKWTADQAWSMTTEEIIAVCDKIEADEPTAAQLRVLAGEVAVGDREPVPGLASEVTSTGHRNEIPGDKVRDDE